MRSNVAQSAETAKPGKYTWCSPPRIDQRKPSITPTIGFNEKSSRHFWGTTPLLNPTGERYNPNCTMKGTMIRKSRYSTNNAAIHKPQPTDAASPSNRKKGSANTAGLGVKRCQIMSAARNASEIKKSTNPTTMLLVGTTKRGK